MDSLIQTILEKSGSQVITVALRRINFESEIDNILKQIPRYIQLLPNTSGDCNAICIARLAKEAGYRNWIKVEKALIILIKEEKRKSEKYK